jgi:predicted metal-dependent HD superfamily phosphohydrolase
MIIKEFKKILDSWKTTPMEIIRALFYGIFCNINKNILEEKYYANIDILWEDWKYIMTLENRYYHNAFHIYDMIIRLEEYLDKETSVEKIENIESREYELLLAIFYHDYVYTLGNKIKYVGNPIGPYENNSDEALSYYHLESILRNLGIDCSHVSYNLLRRLFKITETHFIEEADIEIHSEITKIMNDLDMIVLASDRNNYNQYQKSIIKENEIGYEHEHILKYRLKFLSELIKRNRIYYTEYFYNNYNEIAMKNIQREINYLSDTTNKSTW